MIGMSVFALLLVFVGTTTLTMHGSEMALLYMWPILIGLCCFMGMMAIRVIFHEDV